MRRWLLALLALAACGLGVWWLRSHRQNRELQRIQVQVGAVQGLSSQGLKVLVADILENRGRWVLVDPPPGVGLPPGTKTLSLMARWQDGRLALDARLDGRPLPRAEGPPLEALVKLCLSLRMAAPNDTLVPQDPKAFAELVELLGGPRDVPREDLDRRAQTLVESHPHCASAREAWAFYATRMLVERTPPSLEAKQRCEQNLRDALEDCPGHPRITATLAIFLTDSGRQREALEATLEALRKHPLSPDLLGSVAYAGRTGGLLELADRALNRQSAATGLPRFHSGLADNTRLYLEDFDGFERGLYRVDVDSIRVFYRGYARLLRRDRAGALTVFREAQQPMRGSALFIRLSAVYRLALEGRTDESLAALQALEAERVQVRIPDGEFTFKLAEAYGFLGQPKRALEVMSKAAVQSFGCTPWYERSPFLAEARKLPAWPRLHQTLSERQLLLEQRFPPDCLPEARP